MCAAAEMSVMPNVYLLSSAHCFSVFYFIFVGAFNSGGRAHFFGEQTNKQTNERTEGWTDGRTDGRTDGGRDKRTNDHVCSEFHYTVI